MVSHGAKHPSVTLALSNLANLLFLEGDAEAALALHGRVLASRREVFGDEHFYVSTSQKNVGLCCQKLGRWAEAETHFGAALTSRMRLFGSTHTKTAEAFALLGDLRVAQGRSPEALRLYSSARDAWAAAHRDDSENPALARAVAYVALLEGGQPLPDEPLARFT